jgi:tRNA pseudouridine55 synthase
LNKPVRAPKQALHGWLNIHKPVGMGSTDVVRAVKRILRPEKVGHAGTLDPLADGVLPVALGDATKTVPYLMDAQKCYHFTLRFGEATATDDAEGEVVERSEVLPSETEILALLPEFTGKIQQVPPAYSAIKIDGKRAYDLARSGQEVEIKPREITIFDLGLVAVEGRDAQFITTCSKGTYIRSLARDLARAAGSCGHVVRLHRQRVGKFTTDHAISLDFLEKVGHTDDNLLPVDWALDDIPAIHIDANAADRLCHGQPLTAQQDLPLVRAYADNKLVALAELRGGEWWPKRVFAKAV